MIIEHDSLILYSYIAIGIRIYIYSILIYTYSMDIDKDIPIFTYIHRGLTDTYTIQYLYSIYCVILILHN